MKKIGTALFTALIIVVFLVVFGIGKIKKKYRGNRE